VITPADGDPAPQPQQHGARAGAAVLQESSAQTSARVCAAGCPQSLSLSSSEAQSLQPSSLGSEGHHGAPADPFAPVPAVVLHGHPAADLHQHSATLLSAALDLLGAQRASARGLQARLAGLHDCAARLKGCSLRHLSAPEFTATCLNIYHSLIVHRLLMLGPPRSQREFTAMHRNTSYELGGEALCPLEIDQLLLHGGRTRAPTSHKPRSSDASSRISRATNWARSKAAVGSAADRDGGLHKARLGGGNVSPTPSGPTSQASLASLPPLDDLSPTRQHRPSSEGSPLPASVDPRICLALNTGSRSCLPTIPIFDGETLEAMLSAYAEEVLAHGVQVDERGGAVSSALVVLPKVVEWHAHDFVRKAAAPNPLAADVPTGGSSGGGFGAQATSSASPSGPTFAGGQPSGAPLELSSTDVLGGVAPFLPRQLKAQFARLHALATMSGVPVAVRYSPHDFSCHQLLTRWEPRQDGLAAPRSVGPARTRPHVRTRSQ
jgi:hypothetical protein